MRAAAPKELEPTRGGLTIGHAARAAGVSVETVRFYERQALIDRPDTPIAGYRRYDAAAVNTIRFVKRAQDLGFTLREIKDLLTLHHDDCTGARARPGQAGGGGGEDPRPRRHARGARGAGAHRRWWVLGAGVISALVLYVGWWLASSLALYGGMVLLVAASAINFWARRHPRVPLLQIGIGGRHGKANSGSVQRGMPSV